MTRKEQISGVSSTLLSGSRSCEEFGRRLRVARAYHSISSQELAKKAGISRMAVWKFENGKIYPRSSTLVKIARELNVSIDWLMCPEPLRLECQNGNSFCKFNIHDR